MGQRERGTRTRISRVTPSSQPPLYLHYKLVFLPQIEKSNSCLLPATPATSPLPNPRKWHFSAGSLPLELSANPSQIPKQGPLDTLPHLQLIPWLQYHEMPQGLPRGLKTADISQQTGKEFEGSAASTAYECVPVASTGPQTPHPNKICQK